MGRIDFEIDERVDALVFSALGMFDKAEKYLSERYEVALGAGDLENKEYVLQKFAYLYTLRRDYGAAENAYSRWEDEARHPALAKVEHAFFLFSVVRDYDKALAKVQDIESLRSRRAPGETEEKSETEIRCLFRALQIRGRILLRTGHAGEVAETMSQINNLVANNEHVTFGFELDLIEECLDARLALAECAVYLQKARWSSFDSQQFETRKQNALARLNAADS